MKALCIIVVVTLLGCSRKPEAPPAPESNPEALTRKKNEVVLNADGQRIAGITVETVRLSAINDTISATGQLTVNEDQTWSVGALQDGRISSVLVKVGDAVRQGQVMARVHSHEVHDSRAEYKTALAGLSRAQTSESHARRLHDRAQRLLALKAASQQDVENAALELRNAQTAVENARTEVQKVKVHLTEYLNVPLEADPRSEDDEQIPTKAPAGGIVIDRKITPGSVVSAGQEVFRITSPSSVWMIANVNEADLSQLRAGQVVRVLVRAYPDRAFPGRIIRLGEQLDPTTRTLQVRVIIPNPGGLLKPEMYASAEIERSSSQKSLFIPDAAMQDLNGNRVVFVKTGADRFEVRPVQVGRRAGDQTEVIAGLTAGDQVVVKGSFVLKSQLLRSSLEEE